MSKPDRVVVAGLPHHITHRGNRREQIFRETDDYQTYLRCCAELLNATTSAFGLIH